MRVSCVVTAHANPTGLASILYNLKTQTLKPFEIIVLVSGMDVPDIGMTIYCEPDLADWGHEKRAKGLSLAKGKLVGFFNDDDEYDKEYLERMTDAIGNADIVACNWRSHLSGYTLQIPKPHVGRITSGNYLVRTELAQRVGYNHRHYEADGVFIEDLVAAGAKFTHLDELLYLHH